MQPTIQEKEREYKSLFLRIGIALIVFNGLITVSQIVYSLMSEDPALIESIGEKNTYLLSNLLYAFTYLASFMLPVLVFRLCSKKHPIEPMRLSPRIPREGPLLIVVMIGVCLSAAVINNLFMTLIASPNFDINDLLVSEGMTEPYQIVVQLIGVAIVPGICEEFLFRGMILSNLMPYGKTGAIIVSSLLFGIMHQNPYQMFYTTMAGIALGYLYVRTGSIWCSMIGHILNNAFSIYQEAIPVFGGDELTVDRIIALSLFILFALTLVSILLLIFRGKKKASPEELLSSGVFGKELPEDGGYVALKLPLSRRIRLFFSPTMIVYLILAFANFFSILLLVMMGTPS